MSRQFTFLNQPMKPHFDVKPTALRNLPEGRSGMNMEIERTFSGVSTADEDSTRFRPNNSLIGQESSRLSLRLFARELTQYPPPSALESIGHHP